MTPSDLIASIVDSSLALNALDMGLGMEVKETEKGIHLHLQAGFPANPLRQTFLPNLQAAFTTHFPASTIELSLESIIKAHVTQLAGRGLRGVKNTIAVASGKGGVGKSTVTVNLAAALTRAGARVGVLDADIYGPSIPLMLGQHTPIQIQDDKYLPIEAHGLQAMSIGYLSHSPNALIWRGPMLAKALLQMLDITLWDNLDYLLIDLPPGTGDIPLSLVQKIPLTGAIVVTTPQNVAAVDAEKAIQMFTTMGIDVLGIVENMSGHTCSHCGHHDALFGEGGAERLGQQFERPVLGRLPLHTQIRQECDEGIPTALQEESPLAELFLQIALKTAIAIAKKPLNYSSKLPPVVVE